MESKPKTDSIKSKRSHKKFSAHTENSVCKERGKNQNKLILKRRGLYVERNPGKLEINEVFVQKSSSKSSQRDYPSTILMSSTVGNKNSLTHEVIKSKRRVRRSNQMIRQITRDRSKIESNKCRENNIKASKEEAKDGIVYVLQSRTRRGPSITTTDSFKSKPSYEEDFCKSAASFKREGSLHIDNIPSGGFDSGIDRIAAQILQGWITRKEKDAKIDDLKSPGHLDKRDEDLYSLSLNLAATAGSRMENLRDFPSCSKNSKPIDSVPEIDVRKISFDVSDHTDISVTRFDKSRKFQITENVSSLNTAPLYKRSSVKPKLRPKMKKFTSELRSVNDANKAARTQTKVKRNAKKEFMAIIKKELEKGGRVTILKEPRSMFDALKVVARNKRFTKKRVSLYLSDTDCELQSSNLIASAKKNLSRMKSISINSPNNTQPKMRLHKRKARNSEVKKGFLTVL